MTIVTISTVGVLAMMGSARRVKLSEQQERERAALVYRAIRDAPEPMTMLDLVRASGLFNATEVSDAILWMRERGVKIVVAPASSPGEYSRVELRERLPEAWDGTI